MSRGTESSKGKRDIQSGRPRLNIDYDTILLLREGQNMGWRRIASRYTEITGQYISHMTAKRRYLEAKARMLYLHE